MGLGKYALMGFGGFMFMGAIALPFIPEMTPEQDLASGQRFFASQCDTITRNRAINGKFGQGSKYCECVAGNFEGYLATGDEYRFAEAVHEASGKERWIFEKARITASLGSVYEEWQPKLGQDRAEELKQSFFEIYIGCARAM